MRLRTTAAWSALALLAGTAGTAWLSASSGGTARPASTVAAAPERSLAAPARREAAAAAGPARRADPPRADAARAAPVQAQADRPLPAPVVVGAQDVVAAPRAAPRPRILVPVSMPAGTALPWARLRGHLDGQVLLHVRVDGAGRVSSAWIARSSGDEVLDAEALRGVRQWRFAVPPDAPDGASGDVPVRYVSAR